MSKLVIILGATGKQGGSVAKAFLQDPNFHVSAVTRDPDSSAADELRKKGVDVVQGDVTNADSLVAAFKGTNYIYAMTPGIGVNGPSIVDRDVESVVKEAYRLEIQAGKNIIDAANHALSTLQLFIFSALSAAKKLSGHAYQQIYHFDAKAELVDLIESDYSELAEKTAVLQLGMFATNWKMPTPLRPTKQSDGRFKIGMPCSASPAIPFIDPARDPALFVKALASQDLPEPAPGAQIRKFAGYAKMTTFEEWTQLLNDHVPVEVYYEQMSMDAWAQEVTIISGLGEELAEMWNYCEKIGYFGGERGGTRIITELRLETEPSKMEDFVKRQDWSVLYS